MKRIVLIFNIFLIFTIIYCMFFCGMSFATPDSDIENLITSMNGVTKGSDEMTNGGNGIMKAINTVISSIQYAGSGIALIVITMLGIKYILASPQDKADVKKEITPILIGCVLVFGTFQIAAAIESLAGNIFG